MNPNSLLNTIRAQAIYSNIRFMFHLRYLQFKGEDIFSHITIHFFSIFTYFFFNSFRTMFHLQFFFFFTYFHLICTLCTKLSYRLYFHFWLGTARRVLFFCSRVLNTPHGAQSSAKILVRPFVAICTKTLYRKHWDMLTYRLAKGWIPTQECTKRCNWCTASIRHRSLINK